MPFAGPQRSTISATALLLAFLAAGVVQAAPHFRAGTRQQAGPHPRTILLPQQRATIQKRLEREPYKTLLSRLLTLAGRSYDPHDHEQGREYVRANTARAAALVFYLDRTIDGRGKVIPFTDPGAHRALGEKAATYLLAMLTTSRPKDLLTSVLDIYTAQELHLWADTLDLLLGAAVDVLGSKRGEAIQNVADLAADFYADFNIANWLYTRSLVNNHRTKSAAALGLAAIVLNGEGFTVKQADGRYDPKLWLDFAMRYVDMTARDIPSDPDGGYQEGASYLSYSGIDLFDYLWAWHIYTGGAPYTLDWRKSVPPYYRLHAAGLYTLPDLWGAPWMERQLTWAVKIMMPDGTLPPFDDSTPGARFFFGILAQPGVKHGPLFRWAWEKSLHTSSGCVDQAPLLLAAFDDTVAAASPAALGMSPSVALPYAGQVVFRSSWEQDAVYGLLLCEHGKAAGWTQTRWGDYIDGCASHEHPDGTSFSLYAFGERLAIDGGYLGWDNHDQVNNPQNHNIVLVDGKGPQRYRFVIPSCEVQGNKIVLTRPEQEGGWAPPADGQAHLITSDMDNEGALFAEVLTSYFVHLPYTEVRRRAIFLADRFLLIHDQVQTRRSSGLHQYTFQLHGNGGGTSGGVFQQLPHGGLWSRSKARLRAAIRSSETLTLSARQEVHDAGSWKKLTHSVLEATAQKVTAGRNVEFIALLAPERIQGGVAEEVQVNGCADNADPCIAWSHQDLLCEAWSGAMRRLRVGEGQELLRSKNGAYCRGPSHLSGVFEGLSGDPSLLISARFTLTDGGRVKGWRVRIHRHGADRSLARLHLPRLPAGEVHGACAYSAMGESWQVDAPAQTTLEAPAQAVPVVANIRLVDLPRHGPAVVELGSSVVLSALASCADAPRSFQWRLLHRPELSTLLIPTGAAASSALTLKPDLPGLYQLSMQVSAGGQSHQARISFEVQGEPTWGDPVTPSDGGDLGPRDAADQDLPRGDASLKATGGGCRGCGWGSDAPMPTATAFWPLVLLVLYWRGGRKVRP